MEKTTKKKFKDTKVGSFINKTFKNIVSSVKGSAQSALAGLGVNTIKNQKPISKETAAKMNAASKNYDISGNKINTSSGNSQSSSNALTPGQYVGGSSSPYQTKPSGKSGGNSSNTNQTTNTSTDPTTSFFDTFGQQNEQTYKSSPAIAGTEMNSTTPSIPTTDTKGKIDFTAITKDLESLYNYDTQSAETAQQEIDKIMKNLEKKIPNNEQIYNDALAQSGKEEAQKLFNEKQAQLSAITAKANADKLSLIGQGRGIPEAIIGGQQAQIDREAAIRALPVAAELEAAKGNLEMATENLNTLYKIKSEDASNKYAFKVKVADYAIQFATKEQAKKIEYLKAAYKEQTDREQENIAELNKLAIELAKNGKPFTFLKNIDTKDSNAVFTAIQMAGNSLMDVKSSGSSSNAYTVQPGDTGRTIAAKLGLTWEALNQLNPGVDWNNLRPGVQKLNTDTGDLKQTTTPEIGALSPANLTAGINYMINNNATPEEIEAFKTDREVQAYILNKIKEES